MTHLLLRRWTVVVGCVLFWGGLRCWVAEPSAEISKEPIAIPTFHCIGLYWSPPGGAKDRLVLVRFRRQGEQTWQEGLPMRYNPIPNTDEDLADYRGSIVHLRPGTTYEIQLQLDGAHPPV